MHTFQNTYDFVDWANASRVRDSMSFRTGSERFTARKTFADQWLIVLAEHVQTEHGLQTVIYF